MGFFDALKGAVSTLTGAGAKVSIDVQGPLVIGERVPVRVVVTSTGAAIESRGVFVDLLATETIDVPSNVSGRNPSVTATRSTLSQELPISGPFVLAAGATQSVEGVITIPSGAQATYRGDWARHEWQVRGRLEALGNDPDSGYRPVQVTARP
jgi:hypothetical protein